MPGAPEAIWRSPHPRIIETSNGIPPLRLSRISRVQADFGDEYDDVVGVLPKFINLGRTTRYSYCSREQPPFHATSSQSLNEDGLEPNDEITTRASPDHHIRMEGGRPHRSHHFHHHLIHPAQHHCLNCYPFLRPDFGLQLDEIETKRTLLKSKQKCDAKHKDNPSSAEDITTRVTMPQIAKNQFESATQIHFHLRSNIFKGGGDIRQAKDGKLFYSIEKREVALRTSLYLHNEDKKKSWKVVGRYGYNGTNYDVYSILPNGVWCLRATIDKTSPAHCNRFEIKINQRTIYMIAEKPGKFYRFQHAATTTSLGHLELLKSSDQWELKVDIPGVKRVPTYPYFHQNHHVHHEPLVADTAVAQDVSRFHDGMKWRNQVELPSMFGSPPVSQRLNDRGKRLTPQQQQKNGIPTEIFLAASLVVQMVLLKEPESGTCPTSINLPSVLAAPITVT